MAEAHDIINSQSELVSYGAEKPMLLDSDYGTEELRSLKERTDNLERLIVVGAEFFVSASTAIAGGMAGAGGAAGAGTASFGKVLSVVKMPSSLVNEYMTNDLIKPDYMRLLSNAGDLLDDSMALLEGHNESISTTIQSLSQQFQVSYASGYGFDYSDLFYDMLLSENEQDGPQDYTLTAPMEQLQQTALQNQAWESGLNEARQKGYYEARREQIASRSAFIEEYGNELTDVYYQIGYHEGEQANLWEQTHQEALAGLINSYRSDESEPNGSMLMNDLKVVEHAATLEYKQLTLTENAQQYADLHARIGVENLEYAGYDDAYIDAFNAHLQTYEGYTQALYDQLIPEDIKRTMGVMEKIQSFSDIVAKGNELGDQGMRFEILADGTVDAYAAQDSPYRSAESVVFSSLDLQQPNRLDAEYGIRFDLDQSGTYHLTLPADYHEPQLYSYDYLKYNLEPEGSIRFDLPDNNDDNNLSGSVTGEIHGAYSGIYAPDDLAETAAPINNNVINLNFDGINIQEIADTYELTDMVIHLIAEELEKAQYNS